MTVDQIKKQPWRVTIDCIGELRPDRWPLRFVSYFTSTVIGKSRHLGFLYRLIDTLSTLRTVAFGIPPSHPEEMVV